MTFCYLFGNSGPRFSYLLFLWYDKVLIQIKGFIINRTKCVQVVSKSHLNLQIRKQKFLNFYVAFCRKVYMMVDLVSFRFMQVISSYLLRQPYVCKENFLILLKTNCQSSNFLLYSTRWYYLTQELNTI